MTRMFIFAAMMAASLSAHASTVSLTATPGAASANLTWTVTNGAVNASSGAGGAYQILPSTWELYGGQGEPQNAPKGEQDKIAAEIWADSGPGAWVCG